MTIRLWRFAASLFHLSRMLCGQNANKTKDICCNHREFNMRPNPNKHYIDKARRWPKIEIFLFLSLINSHFLFNFSFVCIEMRAYRISWLSYLRENVLENFLFRWIEVKMALISWDLCDTLWRNYKYLENITGRCKVWWF